MKREIQNGRKHLASSLLLAVFLLTIVARSTPVFGNAGADPGYGNNNTFFQVDGSCNEPDAVTNEWFTDPDFSASGYGNTGDYTWQVNVNSVQSTPGIQNQEDYQFVAFVHDYKLESFNIEVLRPTSPHYSLLDTGENITGSYYPGESGDVAIYAVPTLTGDLLTEVTFSIYVNGVFQSPNYVVPVSTDDPNYRNATYDDQAEPSAYQNVVVGHPIYDSTVAFASGEGSFTASNAGGDSIQTNSGCSGSLTYLGTQEDSNMYYETPTCGTTCSQVFYAASSGGGYDSSVAIYAINDVNDSYLTGYYFQINYDGNYFADGYEPQTVEGLVYNYTYQIYADSYGSCNFDHWAGGSGDPLTFLSESQVLIAYYNCGGGSGPNILVQSENQVGDPITGYYTQLDSLNYTDLASGYTPYTYGSSVLTADDEYYIYADSYGSCTFYQWSNGYTDDPLEVTAIGNTTLTAMYDCAP